MKLNPVSDNQTKAANLELLNRVLCKMAATTDDSQKNVESTTKITADLPKKSLRE